MKIFFTIVIAILFVQRSNAQVNAGQLLIGGGVSYKHERTEAFSNATTLSDFTFSPLIGVFVVDKLATGVKFSFNSSTWNNPDLNILDSKWHSYSVSPFVRYYFLRPERPFNVIAQASYDYYKFKQKSSSSEHSNGFSVSAGPVIFLSPQVALEFSLGYQYSDWQYVDIYSTIFSSIGLQVHLGKEKAMKK